MNGLPELPDKDNLINQKILVKLLRNLGCETFISCDGQDCLNLLIKHAKIDPLERCFDLILMDLEMPILEGMEATRRIRQMEAENVLPGIIPIVAVSGNARPEYAKRAVRAFPWLDRWYNSYLSAHRLTRA